MSLILERNAEQAVAIVEDDGKGFQLDRAPLAPSNRLGLTSMQERAALVGGEVEIETAPNCGTTIFVRLPVSHT